MKNIYRNLTQRQKEKGIVFSSKLVINITGSTSQNSIMRELTEVDSKQIKKLTQANDFKDSKFNYNIIRN